MTTEITDEPDVSAATTRQEAAWARMEAVVRQASASEAHAGRPSPPATPPTARRHPRRHRHLRLALVAALVVGAATAAAAVVAGRIRTSVPTPSATPHAAPAPASTTARLETATRDAEAAVTAEREGLAALSGVPTPTNVAPVTDAFTSSLRLYEIALGTTAVPRAARVAVARIAADLRSDVNRLDGVASMPPALLGAFLEDLTARVDRLETALGSLRHELEHPPTAH